MTAILIVFTVALPAAVGLVALVDYLVQRRRRVQATNAVLAKIDRCRLDPFLREAARRLDRAKGNPEEEERIRAEVRARYGE